MNLHWIDLTIFVVYLLAMLGVGYYFWRTNKDEADYYVGGRKLSPFHIGLSVVATDVGGGFSIGLGGLGFMIGLSGSWMLFTGILGAWLSAVYLIPKVYPIAAEKGFLSFPQALGHYYDRRVALTAGIISLVGYIGFTSAQILAGAKLASATFPQLEISDAVLVMGAIAVIYTAFGGIKAVIYTDTVQWLILIIGLMFVGIPFGFVKIGGWEAIRQYLKPEMISLTNVSIVQLLNWGVTIIPIWFVGMTLYQRIYASRDLKSAQKAWRIAGVFEWPIMAFMGVILGMFAHVAFAQGMFEPFGYGAGDVIDKELALPLFLRNILDVGLMGLIMAAYFSAVLSTADSCLMAASGNFITDIFSRIRPSYKGSTMGISRIVTLTIGVLAVVLALSFENVLSIMLDSYSIMVAGMFIPVVGLLVYPKPNAIAAFASMIVGGGSTMLMLNWSDSIPFGLDPIIPGLLLASITFYSLQNRYRFVRNVE